MESNNIYIREEESNKINNKSVSLNQTYHYAVLKGLAI